MIAGGPNSGTPTDPMKEAAAPLLFFPSWRHPGQLAVQGTAARLIHLIGGMLQFSCTEGDPGALVQGKTVKNKC